MNTVIKVENLSKQYRLGTIGTGSLAHDINKWWYGLRGKENPYLMIGDENDRTVKGNSEYVWALRDINFGVKHGEVLGIIGRNGAGKSTLLKILSRTTSPTTGSVKIKGRVASLLEVGTGFHPELTGRENVFLNGAIMGMTKAEIKKKFDEIVDFSGVERYIDTPVKRYSSGMHVRLAFAVAAYLESEILIVDEVLAVGDLEFQKKCLGKMEEVSKGEGRTVLFVSHNMAAISNLCNRGIVLENGEKISEGNINECVNDYMSNNTGKNNHFINKNNNAQDGILEIKVQDNAYGEQGSFSFHESVRILFHIKHSSKILGTHLGMAVFDKWRKKVFTDTISIDKNQLAKGFSIIEVVIPSGLLLSGIYTIDTALFVPNINDFDYVSEGCSFEIEDIASDLAMYSNNDIGTILVKCNWIYKN